MEARNRSKSLRAPPYGATETSVSDLHTATMVIVSLPWVPPVKNAYEAPVTRPSRPTLHPLPSTHSSTARSAIPAHGDSPELRQ